MTQWNPWHGCRKLSAGCQNCYVYRIDSAHDKDASIISKNTDFNLPIRKMRTGRYKIPAGQKVYTCFSSDFFLDEADDWRMDAWQMMKFRKDLQFLIITKRVDRFGVNLPNDWGDGYNNVKICSTCETQDRADYRLPIFLDLPIKHKAIVCEPLLERINLSRWLHPSIEEVVVGGESGENARICDYEWVLDISKQCMEHQVPFHFKQTGARFIKNGRLYHIQRKDQHIQAVKAAIDFSP